jgi:hypothetical protein
MIPALAFVGGAATMWGAIWFVEWFWFGPIEPEREPRDYGHPYGEP